MLPGVVSKEYIHTHTLTHALCARSRTHSCTPVFRRLLLRALDAVDGALAVGQGPLLGGLGLPPGELSVQQLRLGRLQAWDGRKGGRAA